MQIIDSNHLQMNSNKSRREFIQKSLISCAGCALLGSSIRTVRGASLTLAMVSEEIPDPKKLNYCGYTCPVDCKFLEATLKNSEELKREAFELWKVKERYGADFDVSTIFCYGCKAFDKPEGVITSNCHVRKCAREKNLDCCIECSELESCQKDLWSRFPDFYKYVIDMRKKYIGA